MPADLLRLARPNQWVKNWVVLAALVFAGQVKDTKRVELAIIATALFCLLSSAVYIINDIIDREHDRQHPLKKDRPLASGRISVPTAVTVAVLLMVASFVGAWSLGKLFMGISLIFVLLNLMYSLYLKDVVIVDVMVLALSFVVRAYAGAAAINVPASKWLLINTLLLALFLGFGKRRHELLLLEGTASAHRKSLTHYSPYLLDQLIGVSTASVVVVYMLYTFSAEVSEKLGTENLYLTIPFVIYGIFRYLYLIHRKEQGGSPTHVMFTDKPILITVLLWFIAAVAILYHV